MDAYDEEFAELLQLIFPQDKYRDVYKTLYFFQNIMTFRNPESFRKHCILTSRLMEEFCREKNLLQGTWNGITYARLVGFIHDFGKPFIKSCKFSDERFTGHAQVGARLCYLRFQHEIPEPILLTMMTVIDSHMCCLRNDKIDQVRKLRTNAVMHLYFPSLDIIPILECLHRANAMGRTYIMDECPEYLPESPFPYRKKDKIVIFLIGPSGSGKTTLAEKLKSELSAYGSVEHLERDRVLMEFASEGESYQTCRQRVYDDPQLREKFQQCWTQTLYSADSKILLVDTVQNYYQMEDQHFFHCFRIGLYCIPMNFIDDKLHGKEPNVEFPDTQWMGYQAVLTEAKEEPWQLEVGTGIWQVIPLLVKRYLDQFNNQKSLEEQPTIASLWEKYSGPEAIMAQYNLEGITFTPQYKFGDGREIIRASYWALFDVTYGPTRYYRGEFLLKTEKGISMLRSGFPTFSKSLDVVDDIDKLVVTPKYDGWLVNILYVPEQHKHFEQLKKIPGHYYDSNYGLFFVGSKQTLIMKTSLREKFDKAIGTSFEAFISWYTLYFKDKITTLHFEMMVMTKSDDLTVLYSENFCKFLGYTIFTDTTRSFSLPKKTDFEAIEQYEFTNLLDCEKFMKRQHEKLLEGDLLIEPEGFVLFVYNRNGLKDIIKSKFKEYLAAQKPKCHPELYREIMENPILRTRFQKCQTMSEMRDVINPLIQELEMELSRNLDSDHKTFALYLNQNKELFQEFQCKMNKITDEFKVRSVNLFKILFQHFPDKDAMMKEIINSLERLLNDKKTYISDT